MIRGSIVPVVTPFRNGVLDETAFVNLINWQIENGSHGIFMHFDAVAKSVELPVSLYNVPGRTGVNLEIDTVARLREANPNIIGVKESNKDFEHINRLLHKRPRSGALDEDKRAS